jgi:hypothetical protein
MFINIITPCSRPENLSKISASINIPKENYRWIVVCDSTELPNENLIPKNCEIYYHKDFSSISGNSQRNYALDLVEYGYVYFNDDDTLVHPELWENIKELDNDFISFMQVTTTGNLRLIGNRIEVGGIDSHNFLVSKKLCGDSKFEKNLYHADGLFAEECYKKSKNPSHLPKVLSIYNLLR